jgi:hypothetical protein
MIEIRTVTFDCAEPRELAQWWGRLTGWAINESESDDEEVFLQPPPDQRARPTLLFIKVPEGKAVKNRLHLDMWPVGDRTREQEVERVLGLGAKPYEDHRNPDGTGWMTLLDPEGNEFCIVRGRAERARDE